jgi:hypothetical protein
MVALAEPGDTSAGRLVLFMIPPLTRLKNVGNSQVAVAVQHHNTSFA